MKSYILILFITTILVLCGANSSYAQVSVDNVIVHFQAGTRPVHNVVLGSSSPNTMYVLVEVSEVTNPGKESKENVATTDLLASPKAFSIEPNGQRTVRLLLKAPPGDTERVFRVNFIPQDKGFAQEHEKSVEGRSTTIRILTGMGILVFSDPKKPEVKFSWERTGDKISFSNTGNVQVYLGDGKSCNKANECKPLTGKRIYAGNSHEIIIPPENTVSFTKIEGASGAYQKLTIDPKS